MNQAGGRTAWAIAATIAMVALPALAFVFWARAHPDPASLARRAYDRGEWERAAEALRSELKGESARTADPEILRIYARTLVRLGRDPAASSLYEGRLASADLQPEDVFLKGLLMTRTGRLEGAFELWGRSVKQGVDHPEMLDHFSRLAARYQRMDPALDAARRLCRQPGWEARGLFTLGQLEEFVDNPPGVVAALEDAMRREPEARGALFDAAHYRKLLARNLLRLGRPADAERYLTTKTARAEPRPPEKDKGRPSSRAAEDTEAEWLLSRAYLQQGRMPEAAEALALSGSYGAEHRLMPEPGPYVGSAACVPCHRDESRSYGGTRHTRSFYHGAGLMGLPLTDRPVADPDDPGILHTIGREGDRIEASSRTGDRISRMVVAYAFGTPERYLTMIARDDEKVYRALRVSHYRTAADAGWGPTAGDVGHSNAPEDRLGQRIDVRDGVVRCLHCHVTRSRDFRDLAPDGGPSPAAADHGIGCERCHGPGGNHLRAIAEDFKDPKGSSDFAIVNVDGAPGATANGQCAECHTVGVSFEIERAPDDPRYVRSPAVTFGFSRCFTESRGTMSCMTCHDPHREAAHSSTSYEAKCLSCHPSSPTRSGPSPAGKSASPVAGKPCPVNPTKECLACHMPRVPMPTLHTSLTDHFIRVHREDKAQSKNH